MPSRRKRKGCERIKPRNIPGASRRVLCVTGPLGGMGGGVERADVFSVRQAIRERWPVSEAVRQAVVDELFREVDTLDPRQLVAVARIALAMEAENFRAERLVLKAYAAR